MWIDVSNDNKKTIFFVSFNICCFLQRSILFIVKKIKDFFFIYQLENCSENPFKYSSSSQQNNIAYWRFSYKTDRIANEIKKLWVTLLINKNIAL